MWPNHFRPSPAGATLLSHEHSLTFCAALPRVCMPQTRCSRIHILEYHALNWMASLDSMLFCNCCLFVLHFCLCMLLCVSVLHLCSLLNNIIWCVCARVYWHSLPPRVSYCWCFARTSVCGPTCSMSPGCTPERGSAERKVRAFAMLLDNDEFFSKVVFPVCTFWRNGRESSLRPIIFRNYLPDIVRYYNFCTSAEYETVFHCGSSVYQRDCLSHPRPLSLAPWGSCFVKCLFKYFAHLVFRYFVIFSYWFLEVFFCLFVL